MNRPIRNLIVFFTALLAVGACSSGPRAILPSVSGSAGEVLVVIDKDNWERELGDGVRLLLADEVPYLAQREPLYSLVNVTPGGFTEMFQVHRNIVKFNIGTQTDSTGVFFHKDVWASPQAVVQINASSPEQALSLMNESGTLITTFIEQAERDRVIRNTLLYEEKSLANEVAARFGGYLHFPSGYQLRKATDDFIWIAYDKQYVYQDVLIYKYPVTEAEPFTLEHIIAHRNEIMQANVPGMFDNSYMTTSEYFPPMMQSLRYRGRDFVETRGMWEVANDYMGGPFVSHSFYSKDGSEIIVTEAFVYAPRYDKRQYLRQVEALLYSWEWNPVTNQSE